MLVGVTIVKSVQCWAAMSCMVTVTPCIRWSPEVVVSRFDLEYARAQAETQKTLPADHDEVNPSGPSMRVICRGVQRSKSEFGSPGFMDGLRV